MKKKFLLTACAALLSCVVAVGTTAKTANAETSYGTYLTPTEVKECNSKISLPFGYVWDPLKYSSVISSDNGFNFCVYNDNRFDLGTSSGYNIGRVPFSQIGKEGTRNAFLFGGTYYAGYVDGSPESQEAPLLNAEMDNLCFVNFGYGFSANNSVKDYDIDILFRDVKYLNTASIDVLMNNTRYRLMSEEINGLAEDFERTGQIYFEIAQIRGDYYGKDLYFFSIAIKTDNHCVSYGNFPNIDYTLKASDNFFIANDSSATEGTENYPVGAVFFDLDRRPIHGQSRTNSFCDNYTSIICTGNYGKSNKLPDLNYADFVSEVYLRSCPQSIIDAYTEMYNSDHGITPEDPSKPNDGNNDQTGNGDTNDSANDKLSYNAKRVLAIAFGVTFLVGAFTLTSTFIRNQRRRKGAKRK